MKTSRVLYDKMDEQGNWKITWCIGLSGSEDYTQVYSLSGARWRKLQDRCILGGKEQVRNPSYYGARNLFRSYNCFVEWSKAQDGYDLKDEKGQLWQLDKDFIFKGNLDYSPETCLFVPKEVNTFLVLRKAGRGQWPIGVNFRSDLNKFQAQCQVGLGKNGHLGYYDTPLEAHNAWREVKCQRALALADKYGHHSVKVAEALTAFAEQLRKDMSGGLETTYV